MAILLRRFVMLALLVLATSPARPDAVPCPSKEQILARLAEIRPEASLRTTGFGVAPPTDLYEKACDHPERTVVSRDGKTLQAVLVTRRPVETMWKALNDEPHHALDGRFVPIKHSEIVDGTPRGQSRVLFQYFKKAGVGRWWVSRVEMSPELFRSSGGTMWELHWELVLDSVDPTRPPLDSVSSNMTPLEKSHGAWLLVPLGPTCTLVEYYNYTDPGGFVSIAQSLMAKGSVRDTLDGIVRLADEHLPQPHPEAVFIRPDGSPLD